ncbi:hypothetical protein LP420_07915 [Massilia sp. B-10]|nr:hypothetical protein LP420_07915 [Massilia sp. B-10]
MLLRGAGGVLTGVIADPFDLDLQTWIETQAHARPGAPLLLRLALASDIQAYLSKQEESARAVDSLVVSSSEGKRDGKTAAVLSFASVSEAASPAVKLVNSTLYDALKVKRLRHPPREHGRHGLAVKYRVDGVLDHATSVGGVEVAGTHHFAAGRCWPNSTSPNGACRRTAASGSNRAGARSTCGSRSCPAFTAKTR